MHTAGSVRVTDAVRDGGPLRECPVRCAPPAQHGIEPAVHNVTADAPTLGRMSKLVDGGVLTLRLAETMPLSDAAAAHRARNTAVCIDRWSTLP